MDSLGGTSSADTDKQLQMVTQDIQRQIILKVIQEVTDKCFKKCISKPGTSLDNYQKKCLAHCMDRYLDSQELIERAYTSRLLKEGGVSQ